MSVFIWFVFACFGFEPIPYGAQGLLPAQFYGDALVPGFKLWPPTCKVCAQHFELSLELSFDIAKNQE